MVSADKLDEAVVILHNFLPCNPYFMPLFEQEKRFENVVISLPRISVSRW